MKPKQLLFDLAMDNANQRDFYLHLRRFSFSNIMTSTYGTRVNHWDHEDVRHAVQSNHIIGQVTRAGAFIVEELPILARLPIWLLALYQISPTKVGDIYIVRYGSPGSMDEDEIRADMVSTVERVRAAVVPNAEQLLPVELLAFANHHPFDLHVKASDLAAGFNNRLGELQEYRRT